MDKYQPFLDRYREGITKERKVIIDFIYDEVIPGIKDILSSYHDEQDQDLLIKTIIRNGTVMHRVDRDEAVKYPTNQLFIWVVSRIHGLSINHIEEILNRILSEFGEFIAETDTSRYSPLGSPRMDDRLEFRIIPTPICDYIKKLT